MRIISLLPLLLLGWVCPSSWAETTPNSSVNDIETPPEGQDTAGDPVGVPPPSKSPTPPSNGRLWL